MSGVFALGFTLSLASISPANEVDDCTQIAVEEQLGELAEFVSNETEEVGDKVEKVLDEVVEEIASPDLNKPKKQKSLGNQNLNLVQGDGFADLNAPHENYTAPEQ